MQLAAEALRGWRLLEAESGEELIVQTGALDLGVHAEATRTALAACGIASEWLDAAEVARRWPLRLPSGSRALFQAEGGIVRADRAVAAFVAAANAAGAALHEATRVRTLRADRDGVALETSAGTLRARAVVVTAGSWAKELLAPGGIELPVEVTRETVCYFELEAQPPSLIEQPRPGYFPYALWAPGVGVKAGIHMAGAIADPDETGEPDAALVEETTAWMRERFPAAAEGPSALQTCLYTTTHDERFVLERHGRVVVGSPCSGHGFKFAPAVGARLAALAIESLE